jgi:hypothetical protein
MDFAWQSHAERMLDGEDEIGAGRQPAVGRRDKPL